MTVPLPYFAVNRNGLAVSIDALTPLVAGVRAYFADPARGISTPVPVLQGEQEIQKHTNDGPPGYVGIAFGGFTYADAGSWNGVSGVVWAPGGTPGVLIAADGSLAAPIVGMRLQTYKIWVKGLINDGASFSADTPDTVAQDQVTSAMALSDLTWAAMREVFAHPLTSGPWNLAAPERGEFNYGATLVGALGVIPIPVLGDVVALEVFNTFVGDMTMPPATSGDTVTRIA